MNNTILQQGRFTADGSLKRLDIRSDVDWMMVYNYTQGATQQGTGRGVKFYWQRGMATGTGVEYKKDDGVDTLEMVTLASGGFTLLDSSVAGIGAVDATISAVSAANPPVVTITSTAALSDNDVVRLINVAGAQQLGGYEFSIDVLNATTFELPYMAQIVAGTTGSFRKIKFDPIYYPRRRFISAITAASSAVVTMTVAHGYTVGQKVRFVVPSEFGMTEMDGLIGTITAVSTVLSTNTNTITVDIDSSSFTAFAFPLTADVPFSPALVVPVGEAAEDAYTNLLDDATINQSVIGMELAAGAQSPAGSANDVIYWVAGKSYSVDNE
jgi:hypothetical protein